MKVGDELKIYCLADKPIGKITKITEKNISVVTDRGTLLIDIEDVVDGMVLNYISMESKIKKEPNRPAFVDKFMEDVQATISKIENAKDKSMFELCMMYVSSMKTIFPYPCIFNAKKDNPTLTEAIAVGGIALESEKVFLAVNDILENHKPKNLTFAVDFPNMEKSPIDKKYKKVLCIMSKTDEEWKFASIGFNTKKDFENCVPNWNDEFWTKRMKVMMIAGGILQNKEFKIGKAYNDKIIINSWKENKSGYFYEGIIDVKKLDKKTKAFLKTNKLDPNNYEAVQAYFEKQNMKFNFMNDILGFYNLSIENTGIFFNERRSRTKIVLEAIEAIANK